jgi:membrane protein
VARLISFLWYTTRRFMVSGGALWAGALTYLTLMSLVPGLVVVLSIAGMFGLKQDLVLLIQGDWLPRAKDQSADLHDVLQRLVDVVTAVNPATLGIFSFPIFLWVVVSLLTKVERALNATWSAGRGRHIARRFADYVGILFIVPLLVLVGTGLTAFLKVAPVIRDWQWSQQAIESGLDILPFGLIWFAITLLYKVMPNVHVRWGPATIAGFVAGASWFIAQSVFLALQIAANQTNAIYGSLALLPFFLLYLYLSWTIVLWGAQLCFTLQNRGQLPAIVDDVGWTPAQRRRLGIALMRAALQAFGEGRSLALASFAGRSGWPRRQVDEIVEVLTSKGLLHRVQLGGSVVPSRPPGELAVAALLEALDGDDVHCSGRPLSPADEQLLVEVRNRLLDVEAAL